LTRVPRPARLRVGQARPTLPVGQCHGPGAPSARVQVSICMPPAAEGSFCWLCQSLISRTRAGRRPHAGHWHGPATPPDGQPPRIVRALFWEGNCARAYELELPQAAKLLSRQRKFRAAPGWRRRKFLSSNQLRLREEQQDPLSIATPSVRFTQGHLHGPACRLELLHGVERVGCSRAAQGCLRKSPQHRKEPRML
jgi:hypothetical protein